MIKDILNECLLFRTKDKVIRVIGAICLTIVIVAYIFYMYKITND